MDDFDAGEEGFGLLKVVADEDFLEDFKSVFGFPAHGAEGGGDGKAGHSGAGDADTHSVLVDVSADLYAEGVGDTAEGFFTLRAGERASHGFRAAEGGDGLAVQDLYDLSICYLVHLNCF